MSFNFFALLFLPVILLLVTNTLATPHQLKIEISSSDLKSLLKADELNKNQFKAKVTLNGFNFDDSNIKLKGHTTRLFAKRGYDLTLKGKNSELPVFLNGFNKIKLNSMFTDKSFIREKLVWNIYKQMNGVGPQEFGNTQLWINDVYCGLYLIIQPINRDFFKSRAQKGALFEAQSKADLKPVSWDDIESYYKNTHDDENYKDLKKMIDTLNSAKDEDFANLFNETFDTKTVYDWFILNAITMQGDSYVKNYFIHYDNSKKSQMWSTLPWDFDISMGRDGNPELPYPQQILNDLYSYSYPVLSGPDNVLKTKILTNPILLEEFKKRLKKTLNTIFTEKNLFPIIDEMAKEVKEYYLSEETRWGAQKDFDEQIDAIKNFISNRKIFLTTQFLEKPSGLIDEARITVTSNVKNYPFIDIYGRTIARLKLNNSAGLKSVTIKSYPASVPDDFNTKTAIKRSIQITTEPANSKITGELEWEYLDHLQTREVVNGLTQEYKLQAYLLNKNINKNKATPVRSQFNTYANLVKISIDSNFTGKDRLVAVGSLVDLKHDWQQTENSFWHSIYKIKETKNAHLIAVGSDGMTFNSQDSGLNWKQNFNGYHSTIKNIALANDGLVIIKNQFSQLFRAENNGKSWELIDKNDANLFNCLEFLANGKGIASKKNGSIFKTDNNGKSWSVVYKLDVNINSLLVKNENEFLLTSDNGIIFLTTNSGQTFDKFKIPNTDQINYLIYKNDKEVWAIADRTKIIKSLDSGKNWSHHNIKSKSYLNAITFDNNGIPYIAGNNGVILSSPDDGKTWIEENTGSEIDLNDIIFIAKNNRLIAVGNDGIIITKDLKK